VERGGGRREGRCRAGRAAQNRGSGFKDQILHFRKYKYKYIKIIKSKSKSISVSHKKQKRGNRGRSREAYTIDASVLSLASRRGKTDENDNILYCNKIFI